MTNTAISARRAPRHPDAILGDIAFVLIAALGVLALAGLTRLAIPSVPPLPPPVLVECSDGTCAVPRSDGQIRTITVRWVHPAPAPADDDSGAGL